MKKLEQKSTERKEEGLNKLFKETEAINNFIKAETKKIIKMETLKTINGLINTTTDQFSNSYENLFFQESQLAYNILEKAGAEMKKEEFEKEAWTDIMLDNSDPNDRKFYAVYGEGSVTSNSNCIYIEIEPDESILEQIISILPEY